MKQYLLKLLLLCIKHLINYVKLIFEDYYAVIVWGTNFVVSQAG